MVLTEKPIVLIDSTTTLLFRPVMSSNTLSMATSQAANLA